MINMPTNKLTSVIDCFSNRLADVFENKRIEGKIHRYLNLIVDTSIRFCAFIFVVSVVLTIGPSLESRISGVLFDWRADNFEYVNDGWEFNVFATKPWYRSNCMYVKDQIIDARAIVDPNKNSYHIVEGTLTFLNSKLINKDESNSRDYFGKWRFTSPEYVPVGSVIVGSIKHQCHVLWVSTTIFGPFKIKIN